MVSIEKYVDQKVEFDGQADKGKGVLLQVRTLCDHDVTFKAVWCLIHV